MPLKAKHAAGKANFKDNGWFVGVEPRRNPDIMVCVLLEEGEHGHAGGARGHAGDQSICREATPPADKLAERSKSVEVGAVWTTPDGRFEERKAARWAILSECRSKPTVLATAAPGCSEAVDKLW